MHGMQRRGADGLTFMRAYLKLPRERLRAGGIIALALSLLLALPPAQTLLQRPEWFTYDYRLRFWRTDQPLHPDIAVVLIDEHSLTTLAPAFGRFPWPRAVYAELIDFFHHAGARAVVFDILFSEQQRSQDGATPGRDDLALAEATRRAGNVYHAAEFRREIPDEWARDAGIRPLPDAVRARFAVPGDGMLPDRRLNAYTLPVPELVAASRGIGGVGIDPDADGVFRRSSLFFNYQGASLPAHGVAPVLHRLDPPRHAEGAIHFGEVAVPLDPAGNYLVNMAGAIHPYSISGIFATIRQIRAGELDRLVINPYEFEDKIVFIGSNAVGLQDLKATALNAKTPGVFIHASIASNLLEGDFLRQTSTLTTFLVTGLLTALAGLGVLAARRILFQATLPVALTAAWCAFAIAAFGQGLSFAMATPVTGIALATLAAFGFLAFTEGRDKRRVRAMFSQYVSPAVLADVVGRYEDQIKAEVGTRRRLSILFSDVRGFTALSEQLKAEQVVDLLNTHYAVMGEIIFRHNGTLDKFIGDAIMAFWGAPIPVADHPRQAVCAALEMVRGMGEVNARLAAKGYPAIDIGVGVSTGEVVLGNVGFERKLDYTVIGDHVNLGSRLEGATKSYGCPILIAEETRRDLGDGLPCLLVDTVRVKGRQAPLRIYHPLATPTDPPAERERADAWADLGERAFAAYAARDFSRAATLYAEFPPHPIRELFLERCRALVDSPPGPAWDGVCSMTIK